MWYWIAPIPVVVGILLGIAIFFVGIAGATRNAPTSSHRFIDGGSTTIHLSAGQRMTIYVQGGTDIKRDFIPECTTDPAVDLSKYGSTVTLNGWLAVYSFTASQAGEYTVSCTGGSADAVYGVGGYASGVGIFVGLVGLFVLPAVGFLAGAAIAIIVAVRRAQHKKRLQTAAAPQT
jgi:hypothetical protein